MLIVKKIAYINLEDVIQNTVYGKNIKKLNIENEKKKQFKEI